MLNIEDKDCQSMDRFVQKYGMEDSIRMLAKSLRAYADEMSDLHIKDVAKDAAEMSELLFDLLIK